MLKTALYTLAFALAYFGVHILGGLLEALLC